MPEELLVEELGQDALRLKVFFCLGTFIQLRQFNFHSDSLPEVRALWTGFKLLSNFVLCGIDGLDESFLDEVPERLSIRGETALHNLFLKFV